MAYSFIPVGHLDPELEREMRNLISYINQLDSKIKALEAAQAKPPVIDAGAVKSALQLGGKAPLNVQGLLGILAQPQIGGAPTVSALPSTSDPQSQDGALVGYQGAIYRFNATTEPGTWQSATGSVSSVGLAAPAEFSVSGSPVTGSGTFAYFREGER